MAWKMIKWLGAGYGLLLTMAAGGLVFANVAGLLAGAIQLGGTRAPDTAPIQAWTHWGWIVGVGFALVGAALAYRNEARRRSLQKTFEEHAAEPELELNNGSQRGRRHGLLASLAWGGVFGALLGGMLGCTFILLWFSIAFSPFAPENWGSSVSIAQQRVSATARQEPVLATRHPVALVAFGAPVALGAIAGALFGGVCGVSDTK